MGFETLLGNQLLKQKLSRSLENGHISHFYLISGPEGSGKHTLAKLLAAAILCAGQKKPCLSCTSCRKLLGDNHPDFITVDDPEKKTVPVELIRSARADMYIQPNESDYKIYLFPRAQDMGVPGQNALLKVLEEPPAYGVFLLLTDNPEKLLPTVRSRCVELALQPLDQQTLTAALQKEFPQAEEADLSAAVRRSGGFLGQARQILSAGGAMLPQTQSFLEGYSRRDQLQLLQTFTSMEKMPRNQFLTTLEQWLSVLEEALACRAAGTAAGSLARDVAGLRSARELMDGISRLQTAIEYAQGNVSTGAVCGWLLWQLK